MLAIGPFGYPADYLLWLVLYASLAAHTWCFFRYSTWRKRRVGLVVGNALVLACFAGFAALIAESYLRFLSVATDSFGLSLPARRWFALYTKLNSLGCRDQEWPTDKAAGVRRIAFVGDSFTYGWGIERVEHRFTERLQALFDARAPGAVQIMNVAKPGWDTGAQVQPVTDLVSIYGVDEVVLCYVFNDIEKVLPRTPDFDPTKPPEARFFNPETSCLVDYLYWTLIVPREPSVRRFHDWLAEGYATETTWRRHQEQLAAIIGQCRERGVALRVVLLPFLRVGGTKFDAPRIHAAVRGFFEANGIQVLDLLPSMRAMNADDWVVSRKDAHPNAQAHAHIAEAVWKEFYE